MRSRKLILLVFLSFAQTALYAQHAVSGSASDAMTNKSSETPGYIGSNVIGKSLTNVDLFTGKPQISIPIFSHTSKGIPINVSLVYSSSGIQIGEHSSEIGTGWTMSTGYKISRIINGNPDDLSSTSYFDQNSPSFRWKRHGYQHSYFPVMSYTAAQQKTYYLENQDSELDIFTVAIPGYNVKFVIGKNGDIATLSQTDLKIEYSYSTKLNGVIPYIPGGTCITDFLVTDPIGNKYYFEAKSIPSIISYPFSANPGTSINRSNFISYTGIVEWDIVKIEHSKGPIIQYSYETPIETAGSITSVMYDFAWTGVAGTQNHSSSGMCYNGNQVDVITGAVNTWFGSHNKKCYLTNISTSDGLNVEFTYKQQYRCDAEYDSPLTDLPSGSKAIDKVKIYNNKVSTTTPQYEYIFNHTLFDSQSPTGVSNYDECVTNNTGDYWFQRTRYRLKLDNIQVSPSSLGIKYEFDYNLTHKVARDTRNVDHWGYFNGKNNSFSTYLIPSDDGRGNSIPNAADRAADPNYTGAYLLNKITFNSQAYVQYEFEGNYGRVYDHASGNLSTSYQYGGGMRIKKITVYDGINSSNNTETYYSYLDENNSGSGMFFSKPVYSKPFDCLSDGSSNYVRAGSMVNAWGFTKNGSSIGYSRVVVTHSLNGIGGQEVHTFTNIVDNGVKNVIPNTDQYTPFVNAQSIKSWRIGLLKKKEVYASQETFPKLTQKYEYDFDEYEIIGSDYSCIKFELKKGWPEGVNDNNKNDLFEWTMKEYKMYYSHVKLVKETTENRYDMGGNIITKSEDIDYEYDNNGMLKKVKYDNFFPYEEIYYRAYDYDNSVNNGAIGALIDNNQKNTIIRVDKVVYHPLQQAKIIESTINSYEVIYTDPQTSKKIVEPTSVYKFESTTPVFLSFLAFNSNVLIPNSTYYKSHESFRYYNSGLLAEKTVNGKKESYLYRSGYVSAVVENASYEDIAYSSFETGDPEGYWDNAGSQVNTTTAITGSKSYYHNLLLMKSLDPNKTYEISMWLKGVAPTIDFGGGNTLNTYQSLGTYNGWELIKTQFSGQSNITLWCNGTIDELRLYPVGARMSTIVADPLTSGPISTCDFNNTVQNNVYDVMGRLILVKDHNGNIVKKYTYGINTTE